jgi:hypothetical protein
MANLSENISPLDAKSRVTSLRLTGKEKEKEKG